MEESVKKEKKDNDSYDYKETEPRIQKFWEDKKIYEFNKKKISGNKKVYSVDTPPPTVSGNMHLGHAFSYSQQDFIVRYKRMKLAGEGGTVYYPFGTDDNGLPTERLIEKINKIKSKSMKREEFIQLCIRTLKKILPEFVEDWKTLGISCDYKKYYSTIDDNSRKISQEKFLELYKKGIVYTEEFPVVWCPECQTSIAQAELEDEEKPSTFNTIRFLMENGKELLIATTRPELLPACVGVLVNPNDERYKRIIGKTVRVPVFEQEVKVMADESTKIDKGTGAMMICSYGDKYDIEAIKKHKLKERIIFTKDGRLNGLAERCEGMKIKEARKEIIKELEEKRMIAKKKEITHVVNVHDKCRTEIEFLPTRQWFIKMMDKKKELINKGREIKWYPEYMRKRYENWIEGLEWDWNISRQRYYGIPIPVWKCEDERCGKIILPEMEELPVDPKEKNKKCPKCGSKAIGEEDVLDTWATSSLTPMIVSSIINDEVRIPYSLRPQAHDIIRTWAFYTIVRALYHEGTIPWKEVVISGHVLDSKGKSMHKSLGNAIEPRDAIKKWGVDAIRFWAATSKLGEDLKYAEQDLMMGKKFLIKLWNATKFTFMNLPENYKPKKLKKLYETDRLFLEEMNNTTEKTTKSFEDYEYSKARSETDEYFWKTFCDNYLEIIKGRVYNGSKEEKESAYHTLYTLLLNIIKLYAPITPFITEELYQKYYKKNEKEESIHTSKWPKKLTIETTKNDEEKYSKILELIALVRQKKSEEKKSMRAEVVLTLEKKTQELLGEEVMKDLKNVTNAKEIREGKTKVEVL